MEDLIIPHVRLTIGQSEIEAATAVLRSGYLAMGPVAEKLEQKTALAVGQKYGAAVSSGTVALHVALLVLNISEGDEVVIPTYACQALLNAVLYVKATPRLVDIDLLTFNIDPQAVAKVVNSKTKAIIVPHMFGLMADILELQKLGVPIIEDCAMGLGATLIGKPAGSFGVVSTFSFYATKTITGGEGGLVATSNDALIEAVRDLREYDKKKDFVVRYNYKMSDLNAAVTLAQLGQMDQFVDKRRQIAKRYNEALVGTDYALPIEPEGYNHAFARYVIKADQADNLREYLKNHKVGAGKGVLFGIHELLSIDEKFPLADQALTQAVSLPVYPTLSQAEQEKIINLLLNFK